MSASYAHVIQELVMNLIAHADQDGLTGVQRAVFLSRGGHAPGETCPYAKPVDPHQYWCLYPDFECECNIDRMKEQTNKW